MFFQIMLARFCFYTSKIFGLSRSGSSWGGAEAPDGSKSEWDYFGNSSPTICVIRNDDGMSMMGCFTIVVRYASVEEGGKIISCKPLFMLRNKKQKVAFGIMKANQMRVQHMKSMGFPC